MVDAVTSPSPTTETPPTAAQPPVPTAAPVTASPPAAAPQPPAAEPVPAVATSPAPAPAATADKPAEPAVPAAAEPASSVPTLLEKFDKEKADAEAAKASAKVAEPKPQATEQAKPAEAVTAPQQPTATAPAPVEYKYTLPETIRMDDGLKTEVHSALDAFRANPSEGVQGLINLHEKQMQAFAEHMASEQQRIFRETRQGWAKEILSDPEIGGSGHQTAMGAIARMRDLFVPEKDRPRFEEFLRVTGAGDHPSFLKLLHQAARFYDEPTLPPPNPRPAPGNGRRPTSRLRDIYDHPRSTSEGRS